MENNDNTVVMYLVVRQSLEMSAGKIAAQCSHAAQLIQMRFDRAKETFAAYQIELFEEWLQNDITKIVKRAKDKDFNKVKEFFQGSCITIADCGKTEIPAGSQTVIGIYPMRRNQTPKLIQRLQLL